MRTGLVFGVAGVLSAVAGAYASKVIGSFGARRMLVGSLVGQGVLTGAVLGVNGEVWLVWLATAAICLACVCHLGVIASYGLTVTSGVPNEEQGLATGLVTSTQQVGITIGIPLLGVLATTSSELLTGLHTVITVETVILPAAAVLVALGLQSRRTHPARRSQQRPRCRRSTRGRTAATRSQALFPSGGTGWHRTGLTPGVRLRRVMPAQMSWMSPGRSSVFGAHDTVVTQIELTTSVVTVGQGSARCRPGSRSIAAPGGTAT